MTLETDSTAPLVADAVVPDDVIRRRFDGARAAWPLRRLVVVAGLSPALLALLIAVSGPGTSVTPPGWFALVALVAVTAAATLATYVPLPGTGRRLDVGCTPCASAAALSVLIAVGVVSSASHDVPTAILGLGVAAFGLRQRLANPSTCAV